VGVVLAIGYLSVLLEAVNCFGHYPAAFCSNVQRLRT
jgi:hypothetical protein